MSSLASLPSLLLPVNCRPFLLTSPTDVSASNSRRVPLCHRTFRRSTARAVASVNGRTNDSSWFALDSNADCDYSGWAIAEFPIGSQTGKEGGLPTIAVVGIGISFAVFVTVIAPFAMKSKGFKFEFGSASHTVRGVLVAVEDEGNGSRTADAIGFNEDAQLWETITQHNISARDPTETSVLTEKQERVVIPAAVDSTQLEALAALKKLKIIEGDVTGDELCTKRDYARWLVRANSLLERNPMHRIVPSLLLSGSVFAAFDDVTSIDPDFCSIQVLAEAGIIPSKLSIINSGPDLNASVVQGGALFYPESFVTRQDMISWKAKLDYDMMPEKDKKIQNTHLSFMDAREINFDASPELFMDFLAGENSIQRKVFGLSKRFQPNKPSTKAQAAVAITSGRLADAMRAELSQLEAENSSRQAVMAEIQAELLGRGDIQRSWDEKLKKEKSRGLEVQSTHLAVIHALELEKIVQERNVSEYLKEKTTIDCQRQLLSSLKEETSEVSQRLARERAHYFAEQLELQNLLNDLQSRHDGMLDAKSLLEAEKEALKLLRSWIEDEARKNQARAKVLEEARRRWKWEVQT